MTTLEKKHALEAFARVLDSAPDWGSVRIEAHFHEGRLDRIEEARAEAYKAGPRGLHG